MTVLGLTTLLYALNLGLGVGLQLRLFHLRWPLLHHLLYGVIFVLTGLSALLLLLAGAPWWGLLPSLGLLAYLPRTKAGRPEHAWVALGIGVGYALCWWMVI